MKNFFSDTGSSLKLPIEGDAIPVGIHSYRRGLCRRTVDLDATFLDEGFHLASRTKPGEREVAIQPHPSALVEGVAYGVRLLLGFRAARIRLSRGIRRLGTTLSAVPTVATCTT